MKLNTLYKSVKVECAEHSVVHSSDLCRHQTTSYGSTFILRSNACCRSLIGDIQREHYTFRCAFRVVRRFRHVIHSMDVMLS